MKSIFLQNNYYFYGRINVIRLGRFFNLRDIRFKNVHKIDLLKCTLIIIFCYTKTKLTLRLIADAETISFPS